MIEVKTAEKSFALTLAYVARLHKVASGQGKDATMVVQFPGYEVDLHIRRTQ